MNVLENVLDEIVDFVVGGDQHGQAILLLACERL